MISQSFFLVLLACGTALAQTAFDVASIRPAAPRAGAGDDPAMVPTIYPDGISMTRAPLLDVVQWAFRVQSYQVIGPKWLNELRFDFSSKTGRPASEPELRVMMQALLKDRFQMKSHEELRELPVLALGIAKGGHKLKPSSGEGPGSLKPGNLTLTGTATTISPLADFVSRILKMPVIDETGLDGKFDYVLDLRDFITDEVRKNMPRDGSPPIEAQAIIMQAFPEQLGLKLEARKAKVPVIVIDAMEKTATEN